MNTRHTGMIYRLTFWAANFNIGDQMKDVVVLTSKSSPNVKLILGADHSTEWAKELYPNLFEDGFKQSERLSHVLVEGSSVEEHPVQAR